MIMNIIDYLNQTIEQTKISINTSFLKIGEQNLEN